MRRARMLWNQNWMGVMRIEDVNEFKEEKD
jgi:hypothetical protein